MPSDDPEVLGVLVRRSDGGVVLAPWPRIRQATKARALRDTADVIQNLGTCVSQQWLHARANEIDGVTDADA